jgi:PAS domain S-box-containing protein
VSTFRQFRDEAAQAESRRALEAELASAGGVLSELAAAFLGDLSLQRKSLKDSALPGDEGSPLGLQARYQVLVEQIPAVVFMAYLDGGLSEAYVSPHVERVLGFSQEEWLDDPIRWYHQIHPDDRSRWSIEAAETLITGRPLKSVYRVLAVDGHVVWFRCEAKLVRRDNGQPWFIHGVGFDITDLKETELALQRETAERERLQRLDLERQVAKTEKTEATIAAIVESSDDAILSKNLDGTITSWNAAATRLYGYQPAEIVGKSARILFPPELQEQESKTLQSIVSGEVIAHQETQHITKSGQRIHVSRTISPVKNSSGQIIGASTIARDVTQQKQLEEKLRMTEKLAATGRLAATIAHEINNPLEALTNLLHLARRDTGNSAKTRRYLEIADEELERVAHLTRQTLGFYRDSSSPVMFQVSKVIDGVLAIHARHASGTGVTLEQQVDANLEAFGFVGEFRQVISNLVANAIDAMRDSGGQLIVRARRTCSSMNGRKGAVRVSVADTGPGISPELRDRIFEAFFTTKAHIGTGLGLWLSRGIVEKHGGSIRVKSRTTVPTGTVFSVLWPASQSGRMIGSNG